MAGTRIKVAADISSTAAEGSTLGANATAAQAQAWLDAFEAVMLAAGFVRTADTGQYASVAGTITSTANLGYRCYALSDEYSATSPLVLKVTFAGRVRGVSGISYYRLRVATIVAGRATDGAGNFTDANPVTIFSSFTGAANTTATCVWQGKTKTIAWRKDYTTLVAMQLSSYYSTPADTGGANNIYTGEVFFMVSRLRDYQGNVDTAGFMLFGMSPASFSNGNAYIPYQTTYTYATRMYDGQAPLAIAGPAVQLLSPAANYKLDSNNLPYLEGGFLARNGQDYQYAIDGLKFIQGNALFTIPSQITASGPDGDVPYYLAGSCVPPMDLGAIDAAMRASGSASQSYSVYLSAQSYHQDCVLALDWS